MLLNWKPSLLILGGSIMLSGCSTIVRRTAVDPATAARAPGVAEVVAVNGVATDHGVVICDGDTCDLRSGSGRVHLGTTDSVTLKMVYHDGDTVPGEGVVHARVAVRTIVAGIFTLVGGLGQMGMTGLIVAAMDIRFFESPGAVAIATVGAAAAGAGIALIIAGLIPRAHVDRGVAPAAFVVPGGGGATLILRF